MLTEVSQLLIEFLTSTAVGGLDGDRARGTASCGVSEGDVARFVVDTARTVLVKSRRRTVNAYVM